MVVPITDKSYEYGQQVRSMIRKAGIHCDVDVSNNQMQKKVRTGGPTGTDCFRNHP